MAGGAARARRGAGATSTRRSSSTAMRPLLSGLAATGVAAGVAVPADAPARAATVAGAAAAGLFADDVSNGLRPARRALAPRKTTWNVVAELGDPAPSAR